MVRYPYYVCTINRNFFAKMTRFTWIYLNMNHYDIKMFLMCCHGFTFNLGNETIHKEKQGITCIWDYKCMRNIWFIFVLSHKILHWKKAHNVNGWENMVTEHTAHKYCKLILSIITEDFKWINNYLRKRKKMTIEKNFLSVVGFEPSIPKKPLLVVSAH